jgi:enterochelin esterase family protein
MLVQMEFEYLRELPGGARLQALTHTSEVLEGNALEDPVRRSHPVLLPPGGVQQNVPLVTVLVGYTGFGHKIINKGSMWGQTLVERIGRAMAEGKIPPAVFFWPSCETRLGGSQYLNSPGTGDYEDYLIKELIPFVEKTYSGGQINDSQVGGSGKRMVVGKSSGGYGALRLTMRNPGFFAATASHCGDMGFDMSHFRGLSDALTCWQKYGGPAAFLEELPNLELGNLEHAGIEGIAMASCYSPNPDSELGFDLPADPQTGDIRKQVFERWLAHDPLRMLDIPAYADALRHLNHLYLDAGHRDEFALQWGLKRFSAKLDQLGIRAQVEFYEGGHFNNDHRYEISLPQILNLD